MNPTPTESTPSTKPIENTSIPSNSTQLDPPKSKLPFIITGIILVSLRACLKIKRDSLFTFLNLAIFQVNWV